VTGRLNLFRRDLDEAQILSHARYLLSAGLDPFEDRGAAVLRIAAVEVKVFCKCLLTGDD